MELFSVSAGCIPRILKYGQHDPPQEGNHDKLPFTTKAQDL